MKSALLVENDHIESIRLAKILHWLGYVVAPVRTPGEALNVASAIKFNIIVTCTALKPNDRRALTSELKRLAPEAPIVLLTGEKADYREAHADRYPYVSAVLKRPITMDVLRRLIQFGLDGFGLHSVYAPPPQERRRKAT